jgi:hypothetical protein
MYYYKHKNKIYEVIAIRDIYPEEAAWPYYVCKKDDPIPEGYTVICKGIRRYSTDGYVYLYPVKDNEDEDFIVCVYEGVETDEKSFEELLKRYERALNNALCEYTIKEYSKTHDRIWLLENEAKSIDIPPGDPVEVRKIEILIEK